MIKNIPWILLFVAATVVAGNPQESPVEWSASASVAPLRPGAKFSVKVKARISPGWHIYSITQAPGGPVPTEITLAPKQPFALAGYVRGPLPHSGYDANFQLETETYEGTAMFTVPLIAATNPPLGTNAVQLAVRFQACDGQICLPPKTVPLNAQVKYKQTAK